jgi:hypothetical protein
VKKPITDEQPLLIVERSLPLVLGLLVLSLGLVAAVVFLFQGLKPAGFLLMVPAAILTFQTLWMLLNPFALVFDNRLEIRQSWFQHKDRFFLDLNKVVPGSGGGLLLTYTDGEIEKLSLFGIRSSQREQLREKCSVQITVNAARRL